VRIERRLIHIGTNSVRGSPDYDVAAGFLRPHLEPVDIVAIEGRLTEAHRSFND